VGFHVFGVDLQDVGYSFDDHGLVACAHLQFGLINNQSFVSWIHFDAFSEYFDGVVQLVKGFVGEHAVLKCNVRINLSLFLHIFRAVFFDCLQHSVLETQTVVVVVHHVFRCSVLVVALQSEHEGAGQSKLNDHHALQLQAVLVGVVTLQLQGFLKHVVRVLDLVDVQVEFGEVLAQLCILRVVLDRLLLVLDGPGLVVVVDQRLANFPDELPVLAVVAVVLGFLVVFYGLIGFTDLH